MIDSCPTPCPSFYRDALFHITTDASTGLTLALTLKQRVTPHMFLLNDREAFCGYDDEFHCNFW